MILTCPACRTRYLVDDQAVGDVSGRNVRCASCGHRWHQAPEMQPGAPLTVPSAAAEPGLDLPRLEPGLDAPPRPAMTGYARPLPPRRGALVGIGWVVLIVIVAGLVLGLVVARDTVVAMWPPAGRLYGLAGLQVEPPGYGLEISKITPTRTPNGLIIEGEVANTGNTARDVPRLRVTLRDAAQKPVQHKTIDPPKHRLLPGEVAHFETPFQQPSDSATGVVVTFAPG